jgi:hypothetical protein
MMIERTHQQQQKGQVPIVKFSQWQFWNWESGMYFVDCAIRVFRATSIMSHFFLHTVET